MPGVTENLRPSLFWMGRSFRGYDVTNADIRVHDAVLPDESVGLGPSKPTRCQARISFRDLRDLQRAGWISTPINPQNPTPLNVQNDTWVKLPYIVASAKWTFWSRIRLSLLPCKSGFELGEHAKHVKEGLAAAVPVLDRLLSRAQGLPRRVVHGSSLVGIEILPKEISVTHDPGLQIPHATGPI